MSYSGSGLASYLDTTHSPVGLWKLDGNLLDSSGNGYHLSVGTGTERYTEVIPGMRAFWFDGSSYVSRPSYDAALGITGSMTFQAITSVWALSATRVVAMFLATGETLATNVLWQCQFNSDATMSWAWENGAGVNEGPFTNYFPGIYNPVHIALTRDASASYASKFYLNGKLVDTAPGPYTGPAGGTSSRLIIGSNLSAHYSGSTASVKIVAGVLSEADIRAEYNRSLGHVLGKV